MATPKYSHIFAVEVLSVGRRKFYTEGSPEFSWSCSEQKRLASEEEKKKTYITRVSYGDAITAPNKEIL